MQFSPYLGQRPFSLQSLWCIPANFGYHTTYKHWRFKSASDTNWQRPVQPIYLWDGGSHTIHDAESAAWDIKDTFMQFQKKQPWPCFLWWERYLWCGTRKQSDSSADLLSQENTAGKKVIFEENNILGSSFRDMQLMDFMVSVKSCSLPKFKSIILSNRLSFSGGHRSYAI